MANEIIRREAKRAGVKLWEIADYCGMADTTFSRQMRKELSEEKQKLFISAIRAIVAGRGGE